MLYETRPGHRRLFRRGDDFHPKRDGAKVTPDPADLPDSYHRLLTWYQERFVGRVSVEAVDPILRLRGVGRDVWADEPPDAYVKSLREGWQ
jgi:hypothetical protein